jgi:hypothetical protein
MFPSDVSDQGGFPLRPVRAERAGELWLDTALVALVPEQCFLPAVRPPAEPTREPQPEVFP